MNTRILILSLVGCAMAFGQDPQHGPAALPAIPTRSGNNLRTGVYQDSILTPQAVSQRGLRVYFALGMEGDARGSESQPLIAPNVTLRDGRKRNICVVSSLNNLVWAYDADNSDILWVEKLGIPVKSNRSVDYWGTQDHVGVLSTGVIDMESKIWYGVGLTSYDGAPQHGQHFLYGLNLKDGGFAFAPVPMPSPFDAVMRKQRVSLGEAKFGGRKTIFGASGTVLETSSTAAGFLFAFDVDSKKVSLLPMAKNGGGAGIWMSGSGLILDEAKQAIFGVTGNGTFNPGAGDWAETAFRASYQDGSFHIADWFTPYLDSWRAANSPLLATPRLAGHSLSTATEVQGQPVNGMHGHVLSAHAMPNGAAMGDEDWGSAQGFYLAQFDEYCVAGKDGILYCMKASDMGKTQPSDLSSPGAILTNLKKLLAPPIWFAAYPDDGVPAVAGDARTLNDRVWFDGKTHHVHSEPVVDGAHIFVGAENSNVRAWQANPDGTLTFLANSDDVASPDLANAGQGGMTGWFLCGTSSGLLIALRPHGDANRTVTAGDVFIYDSRNFETRPDGSKRLKVLWRSDQHGINFKFNKFGVPVIWNGRIFIPTYDGRIGTLVLGLN